MTTAAPPSRIPAAVVATLAGLLLGGAWLGLSLHFLAGLRSVDSVRNLADIAHIDLLEVRRREKDFLLRSLDDRAFFREGDSVPLKLHREALDRLGRDFEALGGALPEDWGIDVKALFRKRDDYVEAFHALVGRSRELGLGDQGLKGALHASLAQLEARARDADPAVLREVLLLEVAEREYLLHSEEVSLSAVQRSLDRLRGAGLGDLPERHLRDLGAHRAAERDLGFDENQGLQGRFRRVAHDMEPIVTRVVEKADAEYAAAGAKLTGGFAASAVLLSALLVATFAATRTARIQARHLAETATDLGRSNAELQQFAYVASHDLQEPLRAVAGCVQLLEQRADGKLDAKSSELIKHAVEGCVRMQTLIEDLLTLSRVGTKAKPLVPADLDAVLKAALANLEVPIRETQATVTCDPLPTLPIDPTQILQVFQNLIGNAIKFRSKEPPIIHVGAVREPSGWKFSVRDNGIGIEPQYFERIFRVFQRLHTREEHPGSGIGLAVCEKIVLRHGGRIWLESQLDRGSTFFFTIPDGVGAV